MQGFVNQSCEAIIRVSAILLEWKAALSDP